MTQPTPLEENPHPVEDEDPEACMGEEIPDPWTDAAQTDWKTEEVDATWQ